VVSGVHGKDGRRGVGRFLRGGSVITNGQNRCGASDPHSAPCPQWQRPPRVRVSRVDGDVLAMAQHKSTPWPVPLW
jgi:hypothetical protein